MNKSYLLHNAHMVGVMYVVGLKSDECDGMWKYCVADVR